MKTIIFILLLASFGYSKSYFSTEQCEQINIVCKEINIKNECVNAVKNGRVFTLTNTNSNDSGTTVSCKSVDMKLREDVTVVGFSFVGVLLLLMFVGSQ